MTFAFHLRPCSRPALAVHSLPGPQARSHGRPRPEVFASALLAVFVCAFAPALAACNTCERLETKICSALGAADCAVWRESGAAASVIDQRMNTCGNTLLGSAYDAQIAGARITVDAILESKAKQKK